MYGGHKGRTLLNLKLICEIIRVIDYFSGSVLNKWRYVVHKVLLLYMCFSCFLQFLRLQVLDWRNFSNAIYRKNIKRYHYCC